MMHRIKLLIVSLVVAAPTLGLLALPAHACANEVCDAINAVCNRIPRYKQDCVG